MLQTLEVRVMLAWDRGMNSADIASQTNMFEGEVVRIIERALERRRERRLSDKVASAGDPKIVRD